MKPQFWQLLCSPPTLRVADALLLPVGAALWATAIYSRPHVMRLTCGHDPSRCGIASVPPWDRVAVYLRSGRADHLSFLTQDWAGLLALALPVLWILAKRVLKRADSSGSLLRWATAWILLLEATILNGLMNEAVRFVVQRPRPFVILDPARLGWDPAHYTSFYSGHTSFAALAGVMLALTLIQEKAPRALIYIASGCSFALMAATAVFRVEAGRHYPTDVLGGAIFGSIAAFVVVLSHLRAASARGTGIA